jgi:hypothetical protein
VDTEKFIESLRENKSLIGRPKLLIFESCRGDKLNIGETKYIGIYFEKKIGKD